MKFPSVRDLQLLRAAQQRQAGQGQGRQGDSNRFNFLLDEMKNALQRIFHLSDTEWDLLKTKQPQATATYEKMA